METWLITKNLLLDSNKFRMLYQLYLDTIKISRSIKSYYRLNLETTNKDELHKMLRKIRLCENQAKICTKDFDLLFNYDRLRNQENKIKEELNKRTLWSIAHPNSKSSRQQKRKNIAKANYGNSKLKNR